MKREIDIHSNKIKEILLICALSVVTTLFFFNRVIFTEENFAERDIILVYSPISAYVADRIAQGQFPDWYPYDGLGQPLAGMVLSSVFHPTKLLYLFLPLGLAMEWNILLCFIFCFLGFFFLLRHFELSCAASVLGALAYSFNGYSVSMTNNLPYLMSLATIPWAYWLTARFLAQRTLPRLLLAALAYAMVLFGGDTQCFVIACATGCLTIFFVKQPSTTKIRLFSAYVVLMMATALLTAIQWVPALHVMTQATPGAADSSDVSLIWSFHPLRLLEILFFQLGGNTREAEWELSENVFEYQLGSYWSWSVYLGLLTGVLAVLGIFRWNKKKGILVGCLLFFLCAALGKHVGLYEALRIIPLWKPFRYPEKLLPFVMLCLSILAAMGFGQIQKKELSEKTVRAVFGCAMLLSAALFVFELFFFGWSEKTLNFVGHCALSTHHVDEIHQTVLFSAGTSFIILLFALVVWQFIGKIFPIVMYIFVLTQLFWGSEFSYETTLPEIYEVPSTPIQMIQERYDDWAEYRYFGGHHIARPDEVLEREGIREGDVSLVVHLFSLSPDYPGIFGLESIRSYLPATSKRVLAVINNSNKTIGFGRIISLFSGKFVSMFGKDYAELQGSAERIIFEHPEYGSLILENPLAKPRAYLSRPNCVATPEEALAIVHGSNYRHDLETVVECPNENYLPRMTPDDVALGAVEILSREPEHVVIEVEALQNALLVLTDAYYTGWTATIDGEAVDILPANHAVRGVPVTPGKHIVEFKYRTPGLIPAAIVSVVTLILGVILSVLFWRRARRNADDLSVNKNITDEEESMQAA